MGEYKIEQILKENNIEYIKEYARDEWKFSDTKYKGRFDFYLPKYNRLIEFDGEFHFQENNRCRDTLDNRKERDKIKNQWARKSEIDLIRIPYYYKNKINLDLLLSNKFLVK